MDVILDKEIIGDTKEPRLPPVCPLALVVFALSQRPDKNIARGTTDPEIDSVTWI